MHDDSPDNGADPAAFRLGDWLVEPAAGTISRGEGSVHLEPKVMDVLVFLAEGGGAVRSKDDVLHVVWADATVEEAALSRCISELRRSLGDDAKNPRYIETIPKRGYRLIARITKPDGAPDEVAAKMQGDDHASAGSGSSVASLAGRWRWAIASIVVVVAAGAWWLSGAGRRAVDVAESKQIASVAVLAVQNLTGDPDQDYFAEGITDGLTTELGRIGALRKVTSRASSMVYDDSEISATEIGERLGVDALLEASVLSVAERIRLNVRLVHAASDTQVWSDSFERPTSDVGALYGEIAETIARRVELELSAQEQARIRSIRPIDPEARVAYMKGRHFWKQRTQEGFRRAQEYFERAIELDPQYAAAHVGLADTYFIGEQPSRFEATRLARRALSTALELDDSLADAHASLGFVLAFDWQWEEAEEEFLRAIELNPSYATAHHWYGLMLMWTSRHDEAVRQAERIVELDPLSPLLLAASGIIHCRSGRTERGVELLRQSLEIDPDSINGLIGLGKTYMTLGRIDEAVRLIARAVEIDPSGDAIATMGVVYAAAGRPADVDAIIARLEGLGDVAWSTGNLPYRVAGIYAQLGDHDTALRLLERAYSEGMPDLVSIRVDEALRPLWGDPRFDELVRRMGLQSAG